MKSPAIFAFAVFIAGPAVAVECPKDMPACKVLFLSPQEEAVLIQPNGVLATAADARKVDYAGFVQYFLQRIKDSPAGEPAKPQEKPADKKQESDSKP